MKVTVTRKKAVGAHATKRTRRLLRQAGYRRCGTQRQQLGRPGGGTSFGDLVSIYRDELPIPPCQNNTTYNRQSQIL